MSQRLISRNADLKRLRDEGYAVKVRSGHLMVEHVPYVDAQKRVQYGSLVAELSVEGDQTVKPATHVAFFTGEFPCDRNGGALEKIRAGSERKEIVPGVVVQHTFSSKPSDGYRDHHQKMTTYVAILSQHALAIDPNVTATTFPAIEAEPDDSVFEYVDTASSRAEITAVTAKLEADRLAIVGVGGTGSYVLDLVAKTPVREIHLFDADHFSQHNAFRSPGAASIDDLKSNPKKVDYLRAQYSKMHRHVIAHDVALDGSNVSLLSQATFVFVCLDNGEAKRFVVAELERTGIPFVDVGMGVELVDGSLLGVLRVTTSTPEKREHVREKQRIPFGATASNEYSRNIQIADLNALNAALAVIKWKKLRGFYVDLDKEHFATYTIDGNLIINEDKP